MATESFATAQLPLSKVDNAFKLISEKQLKLKDGKTIVIPMRQDGYINATILANASNKRIDNWLRKDEVKELINELEIQFPHSEGIKIIETLRGQYGGTYMHPDLGQQFAQHCWPTYALQVSRWTRELLLTGSVTLGQEKTQQELLEAQRRIFELTESENKLTNINQKQQETIQNLEVYNVSLQRKHRALLQKRKHFRFEEGHCFYLIQDPRIESDRCKFGITSDINLRLKQHRTTWPNLQIRYLVFIDGENECKIVESGIRRYYEQKRKLETVNHEHIKGVSIDSVKSRVEFLLAANCIQYKVDETIDKYNEENKEEVESDDDDNTIITTKSGLVHRIESHDETNSQPEQPVENENDSDDDLSDAETTVIDKTDIANLDDLKCFPDEQVPGENIVFVPLASVTIDNHQPEENDDDIPDEGTSAMLEAIIEKDKEQIALPVVKAKRKQIQIKKVVDGKTIFECAECGKEYSTTQSLYRHHNEIHKEKKIKCTQEGCDATFTRKEALQEHVNCVHNKAEFKCTYEECDEIFKSPSGLKQHVNSEHKKIRYQCSKCDASFSQNVRLREHVNNVHERITYQCSFCNKKFTRAESLKKHESIHTNTSKYVCSLCSKQCTTKQNLQVHTRTCKGVSNVKV